MRKIIFLLFSVASVIAAQAQIVKSYEKPAEKEFKAAVKQVLKNTSCMAEDTVARMEALNVIQKALDKIQPEYAIFSHAWEMSHKVEKFRWTIDDVLKSVNKIKGHDRSHLLYPCWGDKIVYNKK